MASAAEIQEQNARNMKDFLMLYNKVTEECFRTCVTGFNEPVVTNKEDTCVGTCTDRYVKYNQKLMFTFMEFQNAKQEAVVKELEAAHREGRQPQLPGMHAPSAPTPPEKVADK